MKLFLGACILLGGFGAATMPLPAQQILPQPRNIEGETLEILPDTVSPDGKLALAIRTVNRTRALSLEVVRTDTEAVLWRSNPTGDDTDVFRYRLRAHGFRDMQYAWSPDSRVLAMALATSRGAWVFILRRDDNDALSSSTLRELSDEQLFGDQLPADPEERKRQGGVRKLYMNLEFSSNTVLEVATEGFFFERPTSPEVPVRKLYYEAVIGYDLDPEAQNRVPKQEVRISPLPEKDDGDAL